MANSALYSADKPGGRRYEKRKERNLEIRKKMSYQIWFIVVQKDANSLFSKFVIKTCIISIHIFWSHKLGHQCCFPNSRFSKKYNTIFRNFSFFWRSQWSWINCMIPTSTTRTVKWRSFSSSRYITSSEIKENYFINYCRFSIKFQIGWKLNVNDFSLFPLYKVGNNLNLVTILRWTIPLKEIT